MYEEEALKDGNEDGRDVLDSEEVEGAEKDDMRRARFGDGGWIAEGRSSDDAPESESKSSSALTW